MPASPSSRSMCSGVSLSPWAEERRSGWGGDGEQGLACRTPVLPCSPLSSAFSVPQDGQPGGAAVVAVPRHTPFSPSAAEVPL